MGARCVAELDIDVQARFANSGMPGIRARAGAEPRRRAQDERIATHAQIDEHDLASPIWRLSLVRHQYKVNREALERGCHANGRWQDTGRNEAPTAVVVRSVCWRGPEIRGRNPSIQAFALRAHFPTEHLKIPWS